MYAQRRQHNTDKTKRCVIRTLRGRVLRVGFNQVANQSITQSVDQLSTQSMNESIIQIKSLAARNRCSGVPRSHLALEITARARLFVFGNTRKRRSSVVFSHIPLELTARACSAATGRSESLFGRASKQFSPRNRGSSKRRWIRQHFRVSCGIPFEIALLRTLHCFELCLVRLHRHRQVPYASLI